MLFTDLPSEILETVFDDLFDDAWSQWNRSVPTAPPLHPHCKTLLPHAQTILHRRLIRSPVRPSHWAMILRLTHRPDLKLVRTIEHVAFEKPEVGRTEDKTRVAESASYPNSQAIVNLLECLPRLLSLHLECGDLDQTFAKRVGTILRQTKTIEDLSIGLHRRPRCGDHALTGVGMVMEDERAASEIPGLLAGGLDLDTLTLSGFPYWYWWRSGGSTAVPITCRQLVLEQSSSSRVNPQNATRTYIQGLAPSLQPPPTDIVYSFDHEDCIDLLSVAVAWGTHVEDLVVEAPSVPNEQLPAALAPLYELFERSTRLSQLSLPAGCFCTALVRALPDSVKSVVVAWRYPSCGLPLERRLYAGPFFALRMGLRLSPQPKLKHITIIQPAEMPSPRCSRRILLGAS